MPGASHKPCSFRRATLAKWRPRQHVFMAGEAGAGARPEAVTPELAAMMPHQILHEDEIVLLLTKPSLFFIFYQSAFFILVTLLAGAAAAEISRSGTSLLPSPSVITLIMVVVCVGRLIWALLVWTSHVYMLTNQRLVTIKGVINTHMFQAHLRKVQRVDLYRPLVQKFFGTGTVGISTAAAAGAAESTWLMIARPHPTHAQIMAAIEKANSR